MIELVWLLRRSAAISRAELARRAVAEYAPLAAAAEPGMRSVGLSLVEADGPWDAVSRWSVDPEARVGPRADERPAATATAERRLAEVTSELFASAHGWLVDEVVHWDHLEPAPWSEPTPGVQMIAFVRRRPGLSSADFEELYRAHAEVARVHHPGIARYVQCFVRATASAGAPPLDAVAQLSFASREDFTERFYRDESSRAAVAEDVERFLDRRRSWSVVAVERVLRIADRPG